MATKIQIRRGTAANWTSTNPTLSVGEIGFETDTGKLKVGTGSATWTALPYAAMTPSQVTTAIAGGVTTANAYTDDTANTNLALHEGDVTTHGVTGYIVGTTDAQTLTNKTMGDNLLMGGNQVSGLGTPTQASHAATKAYVDGLSESLNIHDSVKVATTANITISTALVAGQVIDGVTLAATNRVLVKNQITASQNGIYVVQASGAAVRASDYNSVPEIESGDFIFVTSGTVNGSTGYVQTATITTPDTDPILFTQFSGAGTYLAGNGITLTSNSFAIDAAVVPTITSLNSAVAQGLVDAKAYTDTEIDGHNITANVHGIADFTLLASTVGPTFTGTVSLPNTTSIGDVSSTEIAVLNGLTASTAELNTLDGITSSTAELNILDGVTTSAAELNILDGATLTTSELNLLDGITASTVEINYVDGVTSAIQTQLDAKAPTASPTFTGTVSGITKTMVGLTYVDNTADADKPVSTATQTALDAKAPTAGPTFTGTVVLPSTTSIGDVSGTEIGYVNGVTSAIQTQLDAKAPTASPTFTGTVSGVTKTHVGLGNVDNTSDASKPVSTAQQTALDLKANLASPTFTGNVVLPSTTSIGDVSATEVGYLDGVTSGVQAQLDGKAPSASPTFTGTVSGVTKTHVGLANVDNTSDADKPVSTATQTALDAKASQTSVDAKAPIASPTFTGTVSGITKTMVGLGDVDNTSDVSKPVSTATQTALDGKLSLTGGTLTGALTLSGAPSSDLHAATKLYVDNVSSGINFHQPVRVATTANITLSGTQTIDGVSVVVGDRVLVKDETDAKTNGIYVVSASAWSRAADADNNPAGELSGGDFCLVLEGTVNAGYGYICSNTSAITLGVTNVTYVPFNAAKAVVAGTGLEEAIPGTVSLANTAVTAGSYTSTNLTVDAQGRITAAANGGSALPSQSGNTGKVLTTDGTDASWSNTVNATSATSQALVVKGAASQTADLQQTQNSSGTVLNAQSSIGQQYIGSTNPLTSAAATSPIAIGAAVGNGTTATITPTTVAFATGINVGQWITVSGVTPSGYNGIYQVTAKTGTTLSYANATSTTSTVAGTLSYGSASLSVVTPGIHGPALILKSTSGQAAPLQDWQNSSGTSVATISSTGSLTVSQSVASSGSLSASASGAQATAGRFSSSIVASPVSGYTGIVAKAPATGIQDPLVVTTSASVPILQISNTGKVYNSDPTVVPLKVIATPTSAVTVNSISASGTAVTYTVTTNTNPFVVGQTVTITGATSPAYNLTNAVITAVANTSFTVASTAVATSSTASAVSTSTQGNLQEWQNAAGTVLGRVDATGNFTGSSFVKTGGTSGQFLKADGSVDSSSYATLAGPTFTGTVALPSTTSIGTVSATELGYLSGVTSAIQTQLGTKQATVTGAATTITGSDLTVSRALTSNASGKVAVSAVTDTELGYVAGVTSAIQTQLATKAPTATPTFTGLVTVAASGVAFTDATQTKAGVPSISAFVTKTAAYTIGADSGLAERDLTVIMNNTSTVVLSIPTDATTNFPIGTSFDVIRLNTGALSIAAVTPGTTSVVATPGLNFRARYSSATCLKIAANSWIVYGDLAV